MSVVLSMPSPDRAERWLALLRAALPGWDIRDRADPGPPEAVEYVVVWRPAPGWMAGFPNLRAIVSIGAGIDHVLADPERPRGVPIVRTHGPDLTQRMREYVALHVLRLHRALPEHEAAARERRWAPAVMPPATARRVGVMGLGTLGAAAARTLLGLGFAVSGWSRGGAPLEGVRVHGGPEGLGAFLADCEILVCLLPLTDATRGILDARLFAALPRGASLINVGRGEHLVEADLLEALASGRLRQATLDVFATEPLPPDHPFWDHPGVLVTPHVASLIDPATGAAIVAANLAGFDARGTVEDLADAERGY